MITLFVQVDFDKNKLMICAASNMGQLKSDEEWKWIHKTTTDIENFHIKTATIVDDKLVIFSRGKPRNCLNACVSFMLVFPLKIEDGVVTGWDSEGYTWIQQYDLVYPEYMVPPVVERRQDKLVFRMMQENRFGDAFPDQLYEAVLPDASFLEKDTSLVNTGHEKLIDLK